MAKFTPCFVLSKSELPHSPRLGSFKTQHAGWVLDVAVCALKRVVFDYCPVLLIQGLTLRTLLFC